MPSDTSNRRYELDWLRVLAIMIVFLYHSTRFFNLGDWHVKNDDTYVWVEIWNIFVTRWMMPIFFMISGASLFMWIAAWVALLLGAIQSNHFMGVSISILYLILINPPTLWVLKKLSDRRLIESF